MAHQVHTKYTKSAKRQAKEKRNNKPKPETKTTPETTEKTTNNAIYKRTNHLVALGSKQTKPNSPK